MVSLSKKGEKETGNTQQHHKSHRWLPTALLWASGKPAMAQNPPVSGNPACFALSRASSHGHKQIPGNTGNICSLWVLWEILKFRGGWGWEGITGKKRKLWRQTCQDLSFPAVMSWPYDLNLTNLIQTKTKLSTPWSPTASPLFPMLLPPGPGPPGPVHWEDTNTDRDMWMRSLVALSRWFQFPAVRTNQKILNRNCQKEQF